MELLLLAVGLSADAFAVAVCKGLAMGRLDVKAMLVIGAFFGGFQALMPLIGWFVGTRLLWLVEPASPWIACAILCAIGAKMIVEELREGDETAAGEPGAGDGSAGESLSVREIAVLAVATSIDALAAGVALSMVATPIVPTIAAIGITTFVLSCAGVALGSAFGARFKRPAAIAGGIVLIGIGIKTVVEHLAG